MEKRYETIDDKHGEGGFGKVSKYRDRILDRLVAVKQLHMIDDPAAKERFEREAKALAKMSHPNIPAIYDVDFGDKQMLIYFAFVAGRPLRDLITADTTPPMDKARRWFTQIGAALEHAHAQGIIHRDVKPNNIIIAPTDDTAILVDFGIALSAADVRKLTKSGYVIGTPGYMSPEQTAGEDLDGRSDLYSLGITLYETLSGHLPHPAGYQSLSDANETIPPAIDTLIRDCLAHDRTARIQTAAEFTKRLGSAFRTDVPLSSLLTEARLHEIVGALSQMSAEDFAAKPRGQKLLLINRLKDLVRIDKSQLRTGTAQVIALLVRLARFESEAEYAPIALVALEWGFEKHFGTAWQGDDQIREGLLDAAKAANETAHRVLARTFLDFVATKTLKALPGWYSHELRLLAMSLLANPSCGAEADELAVFYDSINEASHGAA